MDYVDVDTSATLTLEEEIQEDYEPNQQEIFDYAGHLGMDLIKDQGYFDIAKAGLKAPLPQEWKPCQKTKNGQQDFYYKNMETGEVSYEHPCDLIFRKRFLDAKALDNKKPTKKSGINKFKQAIEQQRDEEVLVTQEQVINQQPKLPPSNQNNNSKFQQKRQQEFGLDIQEDKSYLMESHVNQPRVKTNNNTQEQFYQPQDQSYQNNMSYQNNQSQNINQSVNNQSLLKNSSLQYSAVLQEQINQEFADKVQEYDMLKNSQLTKVKDDLNDKLIKLEEAFIYEQVPQLEHVKKQFEDRKQDIEDQQQNNKNRVRRNVQDDTEQKYLDQESQIKKKSELEIKNYEEGQEKRLKQNLNEFSQELNYQNIDVKKRVELKKKQMQDSDRKILKEVEEKRNKVKQQYEKEKEELSNEINKKFNTYENDLISRIRQEKDYQVKSLKDQSQPVMGDLNQRIQNLQDEQDQMTKYIKDEFKSRKSSTILQMQRQRIDQNIINYHQVKLDLEEYESNQRAKLESSMNTHKIMNYDQVRVSKDEEISLQKIQNQKQIAIDLQAYQMKIKQQFDQSKDQLTSLKKKRIEALKGQYTKTHKNVDGQKIDQDIDLYMKLDELKTDILTTQDELKKQAVLKEDKIFKREGLLQVVNKYDLSREAHNSELIKYEMDHKLFLSSKLKEKLQLKQQEIEVLQKELMTFDQQAQQIQQSQIDRTNNRQIDQVIQSVNQLKDMMNQQSSLPIGESKLQQSIFVKDSQMGKSLLKKTSMGPPSIDLGKQFRLWQSKLVQERVNMNKKKQDCKNTKVQLDSMQKSLMREQSKLREEIQASKVSYHQSNPLKKDLMRQVKSEIQNKFLSLSRLITQLNEQKALLRQKDLALLQMEKNMERHLEDPDQNQKKASFIENMETLYEIYNSINNQQMSSADLTQDFIIQENPDEEKDENPLDSSNPMKPQSQFFDDIQESAIPMFNEPPLIKGQQKSKDVEYQQENKLVTFSASDHDYLQGHIKQNTNGLRQKLEDQKDWLQNCRYQLSKNISRSPESRRQLKQYSHYMHINAPK